MKNLNRSLQIEQLDKKIKAFKRLESFTPPGGWIYTTRTTLGMSLAQLGKRMGITAQSVKEIEQRERNGSISVKNLNMAAKALGLKLTYGFSAPGESLKNIIQYRANKVAEKIVLRVNKTMQLEDQANSKARLKRAIKEKASEIINKKIKYLWY